MVLDVRDALSPLCSHVDNLYALREPKAFKATSVYYHTASIELLGFNFWHGGGAAP